MSYLPSKWMYIPSPLYPQLIHPLSLATAKDDIVFPTAQYQTFLCLLPIYSPRRLPTILFLLLSNLPLQPAYRMYYYKSSHIVLDELLESITNLCCLCSS